MRVPAALILASLWWLRPEIAAQEVVLITDETYCDCELELEYVTSFGEMDGPGALKTEPRQIRRDSRGIYHVLQYEEYRILRFNPDGSALPPLGRQGQGPGEAMELSWIEMVDDSIVTFDATQARITVFDPDFEPVRTSPSGAYVLDATHVPGRGLVLNARIVESSVMGIPLHLIDDSGARTRSFGGRGIVRMDAPFLWRRRIDHAGGDVWAAHLNQYVIERWSADGVHLRTVERVTDWFEPYLHRTWGGPDEPTTPQVEDLVVDQRDYLRTVVIRASPQWAERMPPPVTSTVGTPVYPVRRGIGLYESVVEIVDPDTGRLFASSVFETEVQGFVDPEHVFSYVEGADNGVPRVTVWRLRLTRSAPPKTP